MDEGFGPECHRQTALFYANDWLVAFTDKQWLQEAFDVLEGLFERMNRPPNSEST
jgi:hypothetical protein